MGAPLSDDRAFSAVFERAVEAIFLADDDGRYVRVNPAAERLTGYTGEELRAMTVFDLTPAPDQTQGLAMWREFIRIGALSGDYTLTRKDGAHVEVAFHAIASIMPGIHLSIIRDVTARMREERALRRAARLQDVTAAMSAAVDTAQVADVILAGGLATLDAQSGHVVACAESGRWFELVATVGTGDRHEIWADAYRALGFPPTIVGGRYRFSFAPPTLLAQVFQDGSPLRVVPVADLEDLSALAVDLGATMICLPLVVSGALVGGLYLFWKESRELCEDERALAVTLAGLCAQALARARLFSAEREARERAVASERTVLEYQQQLQRMTFDRVVSSEGERRRIAVALHDGVTQYLALAKMTIAPVRLRLEGGDRAAIDSAMKQIEDAIAATRSLSFELSPPVLYDLGIKAALSWLGEKLETDTGLRIEIADDGSEPSLDDVTASIVFRAVRELLMNVVKHARCTTATVTLRHRPAELEIVVADAGAGFDPATPSAAGFGLMSVREQIGRLGGTVSVTSARDEGTRACVRVPIPPHAAEALPRRD